MAVRPSSGYATDQELYDALRRRDDRAYQFLYADTYPSFRHWMLANKGTEMDAEDAFQKGMMSLLLNVEAGKYQLQAGTRIRSVLFEYSKRIWLTELASARVRRNDALTGTPEPVDTADALADLARLDVIQAVQQSLRQLKDDCRRLLEWFYVDELPLREIAGKLGIQESSVKSKRYACAEKLKALYRQTEPYKGA
ncbi:hypothetical protein GCM10027578_21540 [Spirosoma luteolum]